MSNMLVLQITHLGLGHTLQIVQNLDSYNENSIVTNHENILDT